ncbi:MAG: DUF3483 domain-containing protein [Henriciella sp.]|nr:DUF3483 domain-containing protein [Henriciella sp.]
MWRVSKWRRGRAVPLELTALFTLPKRYLHDVHEVVVRDRSVARMHVFAAGGFLAVSLLALIAVGFAWSIAVLNLLLLLASGAVLSGGVLAGIRRYSSRRPNRVSGGAYDLLPIALVSYGLFYGVEAALRLAGRDVSWLQFPAILLVPFGIFGTFFLLAGLSIGPMRHAFTGALHLAFHPRPERFKENGASTSLKPIAANESSAGVSRVEDFSWKQLASFDACIQCGRCQDACPAFASGAPLNPKKLIFDLWSLSTGKGDDWSYRGDHHPRKTASAAVEEGSKVIGENALIAPETLWACTTCRACVESCPMMIEHVDAIVDLRRAETLEFGAVPGKAVETLLALRETDTVSARPLAERFEWAPEIIRAEENTHYEALLWFGEGGFDLRGQRTLKALISILNAANVQFAVLYDDEVDCGDLARRLGDEVTFERLARKNLHTLAALDFETILTADPHVLHALRNEYQAFGGALSVTHHTAFVLKLIQDGRLQINPDPIGAVTFHDPCYLGRYNNEFEAPRELLTLLGADLVEMPRHKRNSFCCGWGGGAAFTDVPSERRVPDIRMDEATSTKAEILAVGCPNCAVMFEGVTNSKLAISDVIELVAAQIELPALRELAHV